MIFLDCGLKSARWLRSTMEARRVQAGEDGLELPRMLGLSFDVSLALDPDLGG
jgi:hypothetical protein